MKRYYSSEKRMVKGEYEYNNFYGSYAKVYTLSDNNGNVFYVGCTVLDMVTRFRGHLSEAKNCTSAYNVKSSHIRSLNYKVIATIVEIKWVTGTCATHAQKKLLKDENKWIKTYINLGYKLLNREAKDKVVFKTTEEFLGQTFVNL